MRCNIRKSIQYIVYRIHKQHNTNFDRNENEKRKENLSKSV